MNALEDRLRAALRTGAEDFSAHADAWELIRARSLKARGRRGLPRQSRPSRFMIPAAAAAAVVAVVVLAVVAVNLIAGRSAGAPAGGGSASATPSSTKTRPAGPAVGPYGFSGPPELFLADDPPVSAILALQVSARTTGTPAPTAPHAVTAYSWIAYTSPSAWLDQLQGRQFCDDAVYPDGASSGFCVPLPHLGSGRLAAVTASTNFGAKYGPVVLQGAAASEVTAVSAVLPDGRTIPGVVKTGSGFPYNAWAVGYPQTSGAVRLVFRDASGAEVASLGPAGPQQPPQVNEPSSGGVVAFTYPKVAGVPGDTMNAYLIDGYVGFFQGPGNNGYLSPVPASGTQALAGMILPFSEPGHYNMGQILSELRQHEKVQAPPVLWKAFGYAHADVARVVLHLPNGRQVATSTFAAGWSGSDLRLWVVDLPNTIGWDGRGVPQPTATAYDSSGDVIGQVTLGTGG
jgi:hypothetical protein